MNGTRDIVFKRCGCTSQTDARRTGRQLLGGLVSEYQRAA